MKKSIKGTDGAVVKEAYKRSRRSYKSRRLFNDSDRRKPYIASRIHGIIDIGTRTSALLSRSCSHLVEACSD